MPNPKPFLHKKLKRQPILISLTILAVIVVIFRKFFVSDLLPIPYDILVGWYFPYNIGGWKDYVPGIPFKGGLFAADVFRQMIPWKQLALEQIKSGQLPLWNPYNFSGEPLLANIQATIFYPLTLTFFLFNFDTAWSLYIISSPLLAISFMFLFLRSLKVNTPASLLGGLAFGLSGHMFSWLEWGVITHSGLWLPLILFSTKKIIDDNDTRHILTLIFGSYSTILGGYPQESAYVITLSAAYSLFLIASKNTKVKPGFTKLWTIKKLFLAVVITIILTLPQTIPTFKLFQQSALKGASSHQLFQRTRLHPLRTLTIFSPDYFGNRITNNYWADTFSSVDYMDANLFIGTPALIFVIYSFTKKRKDKHHKFFIFAALIAYAFSLKTPIATGLGNLQIPMISTGAAAGISFLIATSLSILAGFGFDHWQGRKKLRPVFIIIGIYTLVVTSVFLIPKDFRVTTFRNLAIPSATTLAIASAMLACTMIPVSKRKIFTKLPRNKTKKILYPATLFLILSLAVLEYTIYSNKMLSFSPRNYSFPQHSLIEQLKVISGNDRVIGFWDSEISNNFHTQFRIFGAEGYNPLHIRTYQELSGSGESGTLPDILIRSDADAPVNNQTNRNRFIDLASVKYIAAKVTVPMTEWEPEPLKYDPNRFRLIWQRDKFKIYENLHALPRVKIFNNYEIIADKSNRIKQLYSTHWDPHNSLILSQSPVAEIGPQATGSAKIKSYQPNHVSVETKTTGGNSLLLLTDSYYASWQGYIDSKPTTIIPANHTFRAMVIPPGNHLVEFKISWL